MFFFFSHTYERNISFRCSTLKFDELIKQLTNYHNRSRSNFHESRRIPFPRVTKPAYCPVNTHRVMSNHKIRLTFMHCPHSLMFSPVRTTFTTYSDHDWWIDEFIILHLNMRIVKYPFVLFFFCLWYLQYIKSDNTQISRIWI